MTAKKWMSRARRIDREINNLLQLKQNTRDNLTRITQEFDHDAVSGSHDPHKFDRLVALEDEIDKRVDELINVKQEILGLINQLANRNQRIVLMSYYLNMKTWEQIAVDMHYSYDNIMRLRKLGLIEVERILQEEKNT